MSIFRFSFSDSTTDSLPPRCVTPLFAGALKPLGVVPDFGYQFQIFLEAFPIRRGKNRLVCDFFSQRTKLGDFRDQVNKLFGNVGHGRFNIFFSTRSRSASFSLLDNPDTQHCFCVSK